MLAKYILAGCLCIVISCNPANNSTGDKSDTVSETMEDPINWTNNLSIYEVNVRQYTPEGTFNSFSEHLPRLKEMGVGILWLMPVQPIGEEKRKGTLGSYYSIKDYKAINPEFGTMEDFKRLVNKAHDLGMYVILDWVPNHSAWDCNLVSEHPDWYTKDSMGNMIPPVPDWSDVVDFNYDNKELWNYMQGALTFWIEETGIDGYRCDVAGEVPLAFWQETLPKLQNAKPAVFMLAEYESPTYHDNAFHMTYAWEKHHIMNEIAKGEMDLSDLYEYFEKEDSLYPQSAYRMSFITNHDENSWNGTVSERMGNSANAFAVLTSTAEQSMPLVYSGQEAGLDERLEFFEKDTIVWKDHPNTKLYSKLIHLKLNNEALWNGEYGGDVVFIPNDEDQKVLSFLREKNDDKVVVVLNLSGDSVNVTLSNQDSGEMMELFTEERTNVTADLSLTMNPWGYRVYYIQ